MAAVSLRQICSKYLGLTGKISIVNDFYRYNVSFPGYLNGNATTGFYHEKSYYGRSTVPGKLSLIQQIRLLLNEQILYIHLKIVFSSWLARGGLYKTAPVSGLPLNDVTIDQEVFFMRQVYAQYGIAVVISSVELIDLPSHYVAVYEEDDMEYLLDNYGNVPAEYDNDTGAVTKSHMVLFFVHSIYWEDLPYAGLQPYDRPGAFISWTVPSRWTAGHEVGHLCGLEHIDEDRGCAADNLGACFLNCLMTAVSGSLINVPIPILTPEEINIIINSPYSLAFP